MCGILISVPAAEADLFSFALDTLRHRGPDDEGIWCDSGHLRMGFRRLAILDLSPLGHQPMVSSNGRFVVTFNGEVYNFLELRTELEGNGYKFRSESDTEVILAAFEEWGENCLSKFNGMWALAIWDRSERALFLSRDRFGKKPLFFAFTAKGFIAASEMKAIYPFLPDVGPCDEFHRLASRNSDYEGTDKTLVRGIKRFPAGHYGWLKDGQLKMTRWWCTLDHLKKVPDRYEDQVEELRALVLDACALRMRSDVPVGAALSGGLDSSAVTAGVQLKTREGGGTRFPLKIHHAFVAAFPGTPLDETLFARRVAEHLGIPLTVVEINPLKDWERLEEMLYLMEDIYATSPVSMIQLYGAMRQKGIVVTIDGHGPDELLGGYSASILEAVKPCSMNLKQAQAILATQAGMIVADARQFKPQTSSLPRYGQFVAKKFAKKILGYEVVSKDARHPAFVRMDRFSKHLYTLTHDTNLPTLLRNYDRYSMINSVESRMPFMDYRVVTYCLSLPWTSKVRNGYSKSILRDVAARWLPSEIVWRKPKIGFNSPIVDWMQGPLRSYFLDHIHSQAFAHCALINARLLRPKLERIVLGQDSSFLHAERAWTAFSHYLWERALRQRPMF